MKKYTCVNCNDQRSILIYSLSSYECNKVVIDMLAKLKFSTDLENTGKNARFKI